MRQPDRIVTNNSGDHYFLAGKEVTEAEYRAVYPDRLAGKGGTVYLGKFRPFYSDALGVHPDQVPEVMAHDRSCGIATEYNEMGRPLITDEGMYKKLRRVRKVHFNNAYND